MRRLVLAAAAVLVVGGAAAAGSRLWRGSDAGAPEVRASAWLGPASLPLFRAPRAAAPPPSLREAQPAAPAVRVVVPVGARDLYRTANEARRAGDNARAMRVYEDLQRRFPQSPEAGLATVSLGRLLLGGGSAAAALAQFDRCLATSAASRLGAEALYGRGLALAALGRTAEEARTWQRLLAAYPKSPYTAHARRRLETRR
jgi:TolA-binding protein